MFKISIKRKDDAPPDGISLYEHFCNVMRNNREIRLVNRSGLNTVWIKYGTERNSLIYHEAAAGQLKVFPNDHRRTEWIKRKLRDKASKKYRVYVQNQREKEGDT